jgi:hypothetical protein
MMVDASQSSEGDHYDHDSVNSTAWKLKSLL